MMVDLQQLHEDVKLNTRLLHKVTIRLEKIAKSHEERDKKIKKKKIAEMMGISVHTLVKNWKQYQKSGYPIWIGQSACIESKKGLMETFLDILDNGGM